MPKIRKKTSKRGTTHKRHRVAHMVSESHHKKKQQAKKNKQWKSRQPKDPGIPSNFPFKEQVLAEIQETRRQAEEAKQKRKEDKAALKASTINSVASDQVGTSQLVSSKPVKQAETEVPILLDSEIPNLSRVLDEADIVLEVLDSRDPLIYRSKWLEANIAAREGKKYAFILTKLDHVPTEAVAQWAKYLRAEAPVVMCRASSSYLPTSAQPPVRSKGKSPSEKVVVTEEVGMDALRSCLETWASAIPEAERQKPLTVAFVGMVNSGKSSLINSLVGSERVPVYARTHAASGFATTTYPIRVSLDLDGVKVDLIDTPGLMKETADGTPRSRVQDMLLRNKGKVERIKDPNPAIQYILSRATTEDLMLLYSLPAFAPCDNEGFLRAVARVKGYVKKGGDLDLPGAARVVLRDWSMGRFPYYTLPPSQPETETETTADPFQEIYNKYDPIALACTKSRTTLWTTSGLVKFATEGIDERAVILEPPVERDAGTHENYDEDEDEDESAESGASEEEPSDDEDEDSEETLDEEEPQPPLKSGPGKRKRVEQLPLPDRQVKPKKVSFAPGTSGKSKPTSKTAPVAKKSAPQAKKVGNMSSAARSKKTDGGSGAYDFSAFF